MALLSGSARPNAPKPIPITISVVSSDVGDGRGNSSQQQKSSSSRGWGATNASTTASSQSTTRITSTMNNTSNKIVSSCTPSINGNNVSSSNDDKKCLSDTPVSSSSSTSSFPSLRDTAATASTNAVSSSTSSSNDSSSSCRRSSSSISSSASSGDHGQKGDEAGGGCVNNKSSGGNAIGNEDGGERGKKKSEAKEGPEKRGDGGSGEGKKKDGGESRRSNGVSSGSDDDGDNSGGDGEDNDNKRQAMSLSSKLIVGSSKKMGISVSVRGRAVNTTAGVVKPSGSAWRSGADKSVGSSNSLSLDGASRLGSKGGVSSISSAAVAVGAPSSGLVSTGGTCGGAVGSGVSSGLASGSVGVNSGVSGNRVMGGAHKAGTSIVAGGGVISASSLSSIQGAGRMGLMSPSGSAFLPPPPPPQQAEEFPDLMKSAEQARLDVQKEKERVRKQKEAWKEHQQKSDAGGSQQRRVFGLQELAELDNEVSSSSSKQTSFSSSSSSVHRKWADDANSEGAGGDVDDEVAEGVTGLGVAGVGGGFIGANRHFVGSGSVVHNINMNRQADHSYGYMQQQQHSGFPSLSQGRQQPPQYSSPPESNKQYNQILTRGGMTNQQFGSISQPPQTSTPSPFPTPGFEGPLSGTFSSFVGPGDKSPPPSPPYPSQKLTKVKPPQSASMIDGGSKNFPEVASEDSCSVPSGGSHSGSTGGSNLGHHATVVSRVPLTEAEIERMKESARTKIGERKREEEQKERQQKERALAKLRQLDEQTATITTIPVVMAAPSEQPPPPPPPEDPCPAASLISMTSSSIPAAAAPRKVLDRSGDGAWRRVPTANTPGSSTPSPAPSPSSPSSQTLDSYQQITNEPLSVEQQQQPLVSSPCGPTVIGTGSPMPPPPPAQPGTDAAGGDGAPLLQQPFQRNNMSGNQQKFQSQHTTSTDDLDGRTSIFSRGREVPGTQGLPQSQDVKQSGMRREASAPASGIGGGAMVNNSTAKRGGEQNETCGASTADAAQGNNASVATLRHYEPPHRANPVVRTLVAQQSSRVQNPSEDLSRVSGNQQHQQQAQGQPQTLSSVARQRGLVGLSGNATADEREALLPNPHQVSQTSPPTWQTKAPSPLPPAQFSRPPQSSYGRYRGTVGETGAGSSLERESRDRDRKEKEVKDREPSSVVPPMCNSVNVDTKGVDCGGSNSESHQQRRRYKFGEFMSQHMQEREVDEASRSEKKEVGLGSPPTTAGSVDVSSQTEDNKTSSTNYKAGTTAASSPPSSSQLNPSQDEKLNWRSATARPSSDDSSSTEPYGEDRQHASARSGPVAGLASSGSGTSTGSRVSVPPQPNTEASGSYSDSNASDDTGRGIGVRGGSLRPGRGSTPASSVGSAIKGGSSGSVASSIICNVNGLDGSNSSANGRRTVGGVGGSSTAQITSGGPITSSVGVSGQWRSQQKQSQSNKGPLESDAPENGCTGDGNNKDEDISDGGWANKRRGEGGKARGVSSTGADATDGSAPASNDCTGSNGPPPTPSVSALSWRGKGGGNISAVRQFQSSSTAVSSPGFVGNGGNVNNSGVGDSSKAANVSLTCTSQIKSGVSNISESGGVSGSLLGAGPQSGRLGFAASSGPQPAATSSVAASLQQTQSSIDKPQKTSDGRDTGNETMGASFSSSPELQKNALAGSAASATVVQPGRVALTSFSSLENENNKCRANSSAKAPSQMIESKNGLAPSLPPVGLEKSMNESGVSVEKSHVPPETDVKIAKKSDKDGVENDVGIANARGNIENNSSSGLSHPLSTDSSKAPQLESVDDRHGSPPESPSLPAAPTSGNVTCSDEDAANTVSSSPSIGGRVIDQNNPNVSPLMQHGGNAGSVDAGDVNGSGCSPATLRASADPWYPTSSQMFSSQLPQSQHSSDVKQQQQQQSPSQQHSPHAQPQALDQQRQLQHLQQLQQHLQLQRLQQQLQHEQAQQQQGSMQVQGKQQAPQQQSYSLWLPNFNQPTPRPTVAPETIAAIWARGDASAHPQVSGLGTGDPPSLHQQQMAVAGGLQQQGPQQHGQASGAGGGPPPPFGLPPPPNAGPMTHQHPHSLPPHHPPAFTPQHVHPALQHQPPSNPGAATAGGGPTALLPPNPDHLTTSLFQQQQQHAAAVAAAAALRQQHQNQRTKQQPQQHQSQADQPQHPPPPPPPSLQMHQQQVSSNRQAQQSPQQPSSTQITGAPTATGGEIAGPIFPVQHQQTPPSNGHPAQVPQSQQQAPQQQQHTQHQGRTGKTASGGGTATSTIYDQQSRQGAGGGGAGSPYPSQQQQHPTRPLMIQHHFHQQQQHHQHVQADAAAAVAAAAAVQWNTAISAGPGGPSGVAGPNVGPHQQPPPHQQHRAVTMPPPHAQGSPTQMMPPHPPQHQRPYVVHHPSFPAPQQQRIAGNGAMLPPVQQQMTPNGVQDYYVQQHHHHQQQPQQP